MRLAGEDEGKNVPGRKDKIQQWLVAKGSKTPVWIFVQISYTFSEPKQADRNNSTRVNRPYVSAIASVSQADMIA